MSHNCCNHLHTHAALRTDPTRTTTLRKQFEAEFYKRFRRLKGRIRDEIDKQDGFGLKANRGRFDFPRSDQKVAGFMEWLREAQREELIGVSPGTPVDRAAQQVWASTYIESAYRKGIQQAGSRMRAEGATVAPEWIDRAFNRPIHADRLGLAFTRAYNELEGITEAMDQQISRELAQGLADGINPRDIARNLNNRVDKIGITRARTLARTEVVSAHAEASLNSYEEAGIEGVEVEAEFSTAGDDRVCAECEALEGQTFSLDDARGMIPLHPNAVFEGSTFIPYGECEEIVRAWYSGPSVVLSLGGGEYRTTIGPNHPMLTLRGFVNAAQIREGDYVMYDLRHDNAGLCGNVDNQQVPLCEDSFKSAVSGSPDSRISASSSDLHGDRMFCQGKVEAIRPARGLLRKLDVGILKDLSKDLLMGAYPYPPSMAGLTPCSKSFGAVSLPASSSVRRPDSGVVADNNFVWLRVHSKENSSFEGWAFDYTTASSLYCNNGFVVKNCRCALIPKIVNGTGIELR